MRLKNYGYFALLLLLFSCDPKEMSPVSMEETEGTLHYLALGDSYTIGESVAAAERWPNTLARSLDETSQFTVAPPTIVAQTGWTTAELEAGIAQRQDLREQYDLVSLLIGVNNQYRGQPVGRYEEEFIRLLTYARQKSVRDSAGVFVVSIPDYAYTPFGRGNPAISEGIDVFNTAAKRLCDSLHIPFLNITPISRTDSTQANLVAEDGLHPSGLQYQRWVNEVILEAVKNQLNAQ